VLIRFSSKILRVRLFLSGSNKNKIEGDFHRQKFSVLSTFPFLAFLGVCPTIEFLKPGRPWARR
jgi:hypothetical protein